MKLYPEQEQLLVADRVDCVIRHIRQIQRGNPSNNAESFLDSARKSFCLAGKATEREEIERHAAMGREFLLLAHRAADVVSVPQAPSFWHKAS